MIISGKLLVTLFIVTGITSVLLLNRQKESPVLQTTESSQVQRSSSEKALTSHFESLPAESDNTAITDQEILEEDPAQPNKTLELINSPKTEERVAAIEQLGAYPNQASETVLTDLLTSDQEPGVRNAAALSLGIIYNPDDSTVHALLDALEDESENVRLTALSTLENYILQEEEHSEKANTIKFELETKALSPTVSNTIKEAIKEVFKEG